MKGRELQREGERERERGEREGGRERERERARRDTWTSGILCSVFGAPRAHAVLHVGLDFGGHIYALLSLPVTYKLHHVPTHQRYATS